MMNIQEMIKRKKEYGYTNQQISDLSGVPLGTVQKLFSGITETPRYTTLQALSKVFEDKKEDIFYLHDSGAKSGMVNEPSVAYKVSFDPDLEQLIQKQIAETVPGTVGDKNLEDYMALPEGSRIELIDGRFYNMAAATFVHQRIALMICNEFENFVNENGGQCIPSIAPTDVQLDCDDKTVVQPDVLIVCDRNKISKERVVGAPNLVVEVLSPSKCYMDLFIKLKKYKKAGVQEYWIIFPNEKRTIVYKFDESDEPTEYTFEDKVPVGIWQDRCEVDFKKIYDKISFLME